MSITQAYELSSTNQEITLKINKSLIEQEQLERLLDYLFIKNIQQKSQLSENDAGELINEIKQNCWEKQKHLFEK